MIKPKSKKDKLAPKPDSNARAPRTLEPEELKVVSGGNGFKLNEYNA